MGRGGARPRAPRRQADPAVDRLLGVPLVPRDGARVVRGPGRRRGDERGLRQHQGRSRGAARSRPDLPDRARAADAALRRLAAHDVPHAGRRAVLRRHVFPAARGATACPASSTCCRGSPPRTGSRAPAIAEQAAQLKDALASLEPAHRRTTSALPARAPRRRARGARSGASIPMHGGFGAAPKFPHATDLELCLRAAVARTATTTRCTIVRVTLERMADGGIHDQLGGGFCRYSVDAEWTIPHFEKMLYDNGPLLALYADLARVTGEPRFADVARDIVGWMTREMRAPDGAFYSSLDADSEGEEGKFYVWTRDEVRALLPRGRVRGRRAALRARRPAEFRGPCVESARRACRSPRSRRGSDLAAAAANARLERAKAALFAARAKRVRPGRDDKILTSWNALAIAGLARAARALDEPRWADLALARDRRAARAPRGATAGCSRRARASARTSMPISTTTRSCSRRCSSSCRRAFAREDFAWARELADAPARAVRGPRERRLLLHEPRSRAPLPSHEAGPDNATPSGNGVAAQALIALGHLAARAALRRGRRARGARVRRRCSRESPRGLLRRSLAALEDALVAAGVRCCSRATRRPARDWQRALERTLRPGVRIFNVAGADAAGRARQGTGAGRGRAGWVCRGTQCLPPVTSLARDRSASRRVEARRQRSHRAARFDGTRPRVRLPFGAVQHQPHRRLDEDRCRRNRRRRRARRRRRRAPMRARTC